MLVLEVYMGQGEWCIFAQPPIGEHGSLANCLEDGSREIILFTAGETSSTVQLSRDNPVVEEGDKRVIKPLADMETLATLRSGETLQMNIRTDRMRKAMAVRFRQE